MYPAEPSISTEDIAAGTLSPAKLVTLTGQWAAEFVGFRAQAPSGGLGAVALRGITARRVLRALDNTLRLFRQVWGEHAGSGRGVMGWLSAWTGELPDVPPGRPARGRGQSAGRPARPDIYYALLAEDYAEQLRRQDPKPLATLAMKRNEAYTTIRSALDRARKRGLLTSPGKRGVTWGALTPEADRLLKRHRAKDGQPPKARKRPKARKKVASKKKAARKKR